MYEILTQLLDLPPYQVVGVEMHGDRLILDLESPPGGAVCPRCEQACTELHQNHVRLVRDLPLSGKACYLRFVRRRFWCERCGRPFSEKVDFVDEYRDYTRRYQAWIFQRVRENTITSVRRLEGLTFDQIESIFFFEAQARMPKAPFAHVTRLGIDEIALRKGKRAFVLILSDLDTAEVLDVLRKRTKKKLRERLEQLSAEQRAQIQEVSVDMWEPYMDVCEKVLPNARITVDRFHVMQAINTELKALKNKEKREHPQELKGAHYALLKNQEDLTERQQDALDRVYETSPTLKMAHRLKEGVRHIFECNSTKQKAILRLNKWTAIAQAHQLFPAFRNTLSRWLDRIANYFHDRTTTGKPEGINNKIKLIKRRAFGFRNFDHFRLRVIAAFL
jgi:transposase